MNFWRRTIRSILDFASFPGMPDQGGHSVKVLSFSIDYSRVEIEDLNCIGGRKKNEKFEFFLKIQFLSIFRKIYSKFIK